MSKKEKKIKIGLRIYSDNSWMGGIHYVLNWVKALNLLPIKEKPDVYLLFYNETGSFDKVGFQIAKDHAHLVKEIRPITDVPKLELDLFFPVTNIFEAPFDSPWAGWIPDWQCKHLPEMFDEFEIARRDYHYRLLAEKSPFLVLSSQMAYDDTDRIIGPIRVPMAKLSFPAILDKNDFSPKRTNEILDKYNLPERFFLVCNKFWKHKNHMVVFKALAGLSEFSICCVFTGDTTDHRWPEYFKQIEAFILDNDLTQSVKLLGSIPREDQLTLMQASLAVIQPSRFEGWSTVVEEAKALNKTLILSRFPVHLEQAIEGSHFFEPDDEKQLSEILKNLWHSKLLGSGLTGTRDIIERHNHYIIECARQFVWVAGETSRNFNPQKHDPIPIIINFLNSLHRKNRDAIDQRVFQWSIDKTIVKLRKESFDKVFMFRKICKKYAPDFYDISKEKIFSAVLSKHSAYELYQYLNLQKILPKIVSCLKRSLNKPLLLFKKDVHKK